MLFTQFKHEKKNKNKNAALKQLCLYTEAVNKIPCDLSIIIHLQQTNHTFEMIHH